MGGRTRDASWVALRTLVLSSDDVVDKVWLFVFLVLFSFLLFAFFLKLIFAADSFFPKEVVDKIFLGRDRQQRFFFAVSEGKT